MKKIENTLLFLIITLVSSCSYNSADLKKCKVIVNELRTQEIPLNESVQYYVKNLDLTNGIKPLNNPIERGQGRGVIHVYKTKESLNVFIETVDNGHAGESGYAYSSRPNAIFWGDDIWGESWKLNGQVNAYWWRIKYDQG